MNFTVGKDSEISSLNESREDDTAVYWSVQVEGL